MGRMRKEQRRKEMKKGSFFFSLNSHTLCAFRQRHINQRVLHGVEQFASCFLVPVVLVVAYAED